MGVKMEVYGWINRGENNYEWETLYYGNSLIHALWRAAKGKRRCGCVKIEWRG